MRDFIQALFCGRLSDDVLTIFKTEDEATEFLPKIKSLIPALTFTHELSNIEALFVDCYLHYQNVFLSRTVYTKVTSNLTIILYKSDHPSNKKKSTYEGRFQWYQRTCIEPSAHLAYLSVLLKPVEITTGTPPNFCINFY